MAMAGQGKRKLVDMTCDNCKRIQKCKGMLCMVCGGFECRFCENHINNGKLRQVYVERLLQEAEEDRNELDGWAEEMKSPSGMENGMCRPSHSGEEEERMSATDGNEEVENNEVAEGREEVMTLPVTKPCGSVINAIIRKRVHRAPDDQGGQEATGEAQMTTLDMLRS